MRRSRLLVFFHIGLSEKKNCHNTLAFIYFPLFVSIRQSPCFLRAICDRRDFLHRVPTLCFHTSINLVDLLRLHCVTFGHFVEWKSKWTRCCFSCSAFCRAESNRSKICQRSRQRQRDRETERDKHSSVVGRSSFLQMSHSSTMQFSLINTLGFPRISQVVSQSTAWHRLSTVGFASIHRRFEEWTGRRVYRRQQVSEDRQSLRHEKWFGGDEQRPGADEWRTASFSSQSGSSSDTHHRLRRCSSRLYKLPRHLCRWTRRDLRLWSGQSPSEELRSEKWQHRAIFRRQKSVQFVGVLYSSERIHLRHPIPRDRVCINLPRTAFTSNVSVVKHQRVFRLDYRVHVELRHCPLPNICSSLIRTTIVWWSSIRRENFKRTSAAVSSIPNQLPSIPKVMYSLRWLTASISSPERITELVPNLTFIISFLYFSSRFSQLFDHFL